LFNWSVLLDSGLGQAPQRPTDLLFTLADTTKKFVNALSKHAEQAHARQMGVAVLYNACRDWSIVKESQPTYSLVRHRRKSHRCFLCPRQMMATFVGKC